MSCIHREKSLAPLGRHPEGLPTKSPPDLIKFTFEYLSTAFPRQTGFVQTELTHAHVINACHKQEGLPVGMELQLSNDPLSLKVCKPPSFLLVEAGLSWWVWPDEGHTEVALLLAGGWFRGRGRQGGEAMLTGRRGGRVLSSCSGWRRGDILCVCVCACACVCM